ncbi:MAG: transglutaminase domain-containing protein [Bacteroidales bacterium]|nr:transglutaminase domain-containing protein [Bacteroidales bacterium]
MRKRTFLCLATVAVMLCVGCRKQHFIKDDALRKQVHADFLQRQALANERAEPLYGGMDTLGLEEREALEFLYAYMPYSDMADYDGAFNLSQVRTALAARDTFSWGRHVPDDIFRHFVLVYRVNNENLDTARQYMFHALKERVRGLSMYEAALEVNHWCHEHMAYRASDGRTSAPLASLRTSLGRCGEESTFAVTALRSVGIPARQCYTPRWAHCDDNHAWVEVWVDGRWHFMGACEPDPELDMGWFAVPSTRTMMVHSNAYGRYMGDEEVNFRTGLTSRINMLHNYAPVRTLKVTVKDAEGRVQPGATVRFKLYNYAEYYPLATVTCDAQGQAQLTTGHGDLLIWATDGQRYAYNKVDVRKADTLTLYLTREAGREYVEELNMVPPVAGEARVTPTAAQVQHNAQRLAYEDSLRNAYTSTFPTQHTFRALFGDTMPEGPEASLTATQVWDFIRRSEGNYRAVARFIGAHLLRSSGGAQLYDYLMSYSDKDLRDMDCATLEAHLTSYDAFASAVPYDVYRRGLLPARISNELVRPWRQPLASFVGQSFGEQASAAELQAWTAQHIAVDDTGNYYNCPVSPVGVLQLRHADRHSRDIFYVALCRAAGVPAYLDNATNLIYVYEGGWRTVAFEARRLSQPTASLTLTWSGRGTKPVYWSHFSLAKYEDGDFVSYDFEDDPRMASFPATVALEPGYYCLCTGSRYPDGDVLSRMEFFVVDSGQRVTKELVMRPLVSKQTSVLGVVDPAYELIEGMATLGEYAGEKGMVCLFLGDYREPSKHLVVELQALRERLRLWGGMVYLCAPQNAQAMSWQLPNADCVVADASHPDPLQVKLVEATGLNFADDYPLVAVLNGRGEVLFCHSGYRIGLAEQLLRVAERR